MPDYDADPRGQQTTTYLVPESEVAAFDAGQADARIARDHAENVAALAKAKAGQ